MDRAKSSKQKGLSKLNPDDYEEITVEVKPEHVYVNHEKNGYFAVKNIYINPSYSLSPEGQECNDIAIVEVCSLNIHL